MTDTAIVKQQDQPEEKALAKISNYLDRADVRGRFVELMGSREAAAYINQVLIAVTNSTDLQECSMQSIYTSALTIATLRLSVDPSIHEAYIVAKKGRAEPWVSYKGLYDMALRTGKYRRLDVYQLYEGEEFIEDKITGAVRMGGSKTGDKIIGWLGVFEYVPVPRGEHIFKFLYMTVEEIHKHAKAHNPSGYDNQKMPWKKNELTKQSMERKTVLRIMLNRWGYIDPADRDVLDAIEDGGSVDAEQFNKVANALDGRIVEDEQKETRSPEQAATELGFKPEKNPSPIDDKLWDQWQSVCVRAEKVDIGYALVDREKTTAAELMLALSQLTAEVVNAERDAKISATAKP